MKQIIYIYISKIKHNKQTLKTRVNKRQDKKEIESPREFTVSKLLAEYFVAKLTQDN